MIRNLLLYVLFLSLPFMAKAQLEAGIQVGTSNYFGDLAPRDAWSSIGETNFSAGIFARYNISPWIGVKTAFNYGKITADDINSPERYRSSRNLHFRSNIYELTLNGELNVLGFAPYNLRKTFSPYIFAGVSIFKFNPKAKFEGRWLALQPIGTEGQGIIGRPDKYKLVQIAIPVGVGIKYAVNDLWNVGIEIGIRKLFTDYIDDVSDVYMDLQELEEQNGTLAAELSWRGDEYDPTLTVPVEGSVRGNPKNNDWYMMSFISVSYNFTDNGLVGSRGRSYNKTGCPTF